MLSQIVTRFANLRIEVIAERRLQSTRIMTVPGTNGNGVSFGFNLQERCKMTNIDQWVENNTFWCKQFNAKISKTQCRFNCAKTTIALGKYSKRKTKHLWHHLLMNKLTLLFASCCTCDRYSNKIDMDDLIKVSYDKNVFKNRKSIEFFEELVHG